MIPDCRSRVEAYDFIKTLPDLDAPKIFIKDIAKDMFIAGSDHVERLVQHGRNLSRETLQRHRSMLDTIVKQFGDIELKALTTVMVDDYLRSLVKQGGCWKNSFLETLTYVYKEASFCGCEAIQKPTFMRFARNLKKADIFTTEELKQFFNCNLWSNSRDYLA
ncbi:MAG: hypothetical protein II814_01380, partial [Treponema sp.]|nr:hypothetical protein [Treponema sp.]